MNRLPEVELRERSSNARERSHGQTRLHVFLIPALLIQLAVFGVSAQTLTTLHSFTGASGDGSQPVGGLVQATDGNLYGTTSTGGANGYGTVFKITTNGVVTILHSFTGASGGGDGAALYAGLVQATDGNLYGTANGGGANAGGTVFKITTNGVLALLHAFPSGSGDGDGPVGGLVQATDGNLYGTTSTGGAIDDGTVFKITTNGVVTILHSFTGASGDGENPQAGLVQATDGNLYGTTELGGANGWGTVFKITTNGVVTILHSFTRASGDGSTPVAGLVQATDGNLYGTTEQGGANGGGAVFKITTNGVLTILHSFDASGDVPVGGLVQATDGNFYGTTKSGGANGYGTVFKITTNGVVTILHSFTGASGDGESPRAGLVQATDGNFYGTTMSGGAIGNGTVFKMINPSPTITSTSPLPTGTVGVAYSQTLQATGGTKPYSWSVVSNTLPTGLGLVVSSGAITGTPTSATTAIFRVRVTGADSLYSEQNFSLMINASAYGSWKVSWFTPSQLADSTVSGDFANPAHDGIVNLLKYALGLNPTNVTVNGLPTAAVSSNNYLTLTYRQNKQATDLTYTIEACGSLTSNSWLTNGLTTISQADCNTYWSVTVRDSVPFTNAVSRFMHLKVTGP